MSNSHKLRFPNSSRITHYSSLGSRARIHIDVGAWLSLVERSVRDREVGGSNPLAPTIFP
jgi:hypothetical protein